jgi:hypothetical protein
MVIVPSLFGLYTRSARYQHNRFDRSGNRPAYRRAAFKRASPPSLADPRHAVDARSKFPHIIATQNQKARLGGCPSIDAAIEEV